MRYILTSLAMALLLSASATGQMDSVIIGSVNVDSGSAGTFVPIWVTTVDTCETVWWQLCLRSANDEDAYFGSVQYFYPLNLWDMRSDTITQNGRALGITAFAQTDPGPGPYPLFTDNQRWNIITLLIGIDPDLPPRQIMVDSLRAIHMGRDGTVFVPGVINIGEQSANNESIRPELSGLSQNYPNPFNARTAISYAIPQAGWVSLYIYNLMGQRVARLYEGTQQPGEYRVTWNASDVPSGIYLCRLTAGNNVESKRMVLLR